VPEGIVKRFFQDRGYGFITPAEGGKDLFVHVSGIQGSGLLGLEEGQRVSFEVEQDPRGPKATRVVPL
jgi:CspA family cold shock protein